MWILRIRKIFVIHNKDCLALMHAEALRRACVKAPLENSVNPLSHPASIPFSILSVSDVLFDLSCPKILWTPTSNLTIGDAVDREAQELGLYVPAGGAGGVPVQAAAPRQLLNYLEVCAVWHPSQVMVMHEEKLVLLWGAYKERRGYKEKNGRATMGGLQREEWACHFSQK